MARLDEYPQPSVAVDTAVLTLEPNGGDLLVLQVPRPHERGWALPGTFMHVDELLEEAVHRSLRDKAGVAGLTPRQLHVFDAIDRDDRGRVLSVAHMAVVPLAALDERFPDRTRLMPVSRPGRMWRDHEAIIDAAVARLRAEYAEHPDPDRLAGETFTLSDLRRVHEAVAGEPIPRDAFARRLTKRGLIEPTGETTEGSRGRPAEVYRRQGSPMRR